MDGTNLTMKLMCVSTEYDLRETNRNWKMYSQTHYVNVCTIHMLNFHIIFFDLSNSDLNVLEFGRDPRVASFCIMNWEFFENQTCSHRHRYVNAYAFTRILLRNNAKWKPLWSIKERMGYGMLSLESNETTNGIRDQE